MRHGTSNRRHRNRNNNGGHAGNYNNQQRTKVYDSNGPDVRIRGTAHQVAEKYLALAKDATSIGDSIVAQNYYQHAEHYIRIINEMSGHDTNNIKDAHKAKPVLDDEGNQKTQESAVKEMEDLSLPVGILGTEKSTQKEKEAVE